ncbi:MAG: SCO family protein [Alphaproteobacteria bacterium]|nr:SCO family protein [Alphaproteobacteria bacterium]
MSLLLDLILAAAVLAAADAPTTHAAAQATPAPAADLATLGQGIETVELVDDAGERVRWADLKGRPRAVFFGFTRCPVICPVTVWEIDAALEKVGPGAEKVQMNFVTLDPARDTPETMGNYFTSFKARMRAMTGSAANVARVAKSFDVVHKKVALSNGDYTLDHTAAVFLLDEKGNVVDVMGYGTPQDVMVKRFKQLLGVK